MKRSFVSLWICVCFDLYIFCGRVVKFQRSFQCEEFFSSFIYFRLARRSSAIQHAHSGVRLTGENDRRCNFSSRNRFTKWAIDVHHTKNFYQWEIKLLYDFVFLLRFILFPQVFFILFILIIRCFVELISLRMRITFGSAMLIDWWMIWACEGTWKNLII